MQEHPPMREMEIGEVTHYWNHLGVAGVHLSESVELGDHIHIHGHTSDFDQRVGSIQIQHHAVAHADRGEDVGIRVSEHVREHDKVYRLIDLADMAVDELEL